MRQEINICWFTSAHRCLKVTIHQEILLPETVSRNNVACKNTPETLLPAKGNDDVHQHHVIPSFVIK